MDNYGAILHELRSQLQMSASELSKGICSQKYIYMIESNERVPSAEILYKLFNKLNFDYEDYLHYVETDNALEVRALVMEIDWARDIDDYKSVGRLLKVLDTYNSGSLDSYIAYNKASRLYYLKNEEDEALSIINEALGQAGYTSFDRGMVLSYDLYDMFMFNLSALIQFRHGDREQIKTVESIYDYCRQRLLSKRFNQFIAVNALAYGYMLLETDCVDEALSVLDECRKFQMKTMVCHKRHILHFLLAKGYGMKGEGEMALKELAVARHCTDAIQNGRWSMDVDLLEKELKQLSQWDDNSRIPRSILLKKEVTLDGGKHSFYIQLYEGGIIMVIFESFDQRLLFELTDQINDLVESYMAPGQTTHLIFDIRKLTFQDVTINAAYSHVTTGYLKRPCRTIVRVQGTLSGDNRILDMIFDQFESGLQGQGLQLHSRVNNINQAMVLTTSFIEAER